MGERGTDFDLDYCEAPSGTTPQSLSRSTATGAEIIANIQATKEKLLAEAYQPPPPPYILSPRAHDHACDLLELPRGTALTNSQVDQAAVIELKRMTPEKRNRILAAMFSSARW